MDCIPCGDADAKTIDGFSNVCHSDCASQVKIIMKNSNCSVCNNACKSCKDS